MGVIDVIKTIGRNVSALGGDVQKKPVRVLNTSRAAEQIVEDVRSDEAREQKRISQRQRQAITSARKAIESPRVITRTKSIYNVGGVKYHATRSKGISQRTPGRPKQSYKPRVDPLTGRIVRMPATVLYKRQRLAKRLQSAGYQKRQLEKAQFYQQKGIPPQQAAQIEMMRQQRMAQQLAGQQPMPQEVQEVQIQAPQRQQAQQMQRQQFQHMRRPQFQMEQRQHVVPNFFTGGTSVRPRERWLG